MTLSTIQDTANTNLLQLLSPWALRAASRSEDGGSGHESRSGCSCPGAPPATEQPDFARKLQTINREDTVDISASFELNLLQASAAGISAPLTPGGLGSPLGNPYAMPRLGQVTASAATIVQLRLLVTYQIHLSIPAGGVVDVMA